MRSTSKMVITVESSDPERNEIALVLIQWALEEAGATIRDAHHRRGLLDVLDAKTDPFAGVELVLQGIRRLAV